MSTMREYKTQEQCMSTIHKNNTKVQYTLPLALNGNARIDIDWEQSRVVSGFPESVLRI